MDPKSGWFRPTAQPTPLPGKDSWDPADDQRTTAVPISPSALVQVHGPHNLGWSADDSEDWFGFSGAAGQVYSFATTRSDGTGTLLADIYDATGTLLQSYSGAPDLGISFAAAASGAFSLRLRSLSGGFSGSLAFSSAFATQTISPTFSHSPTATPSPTRSASPSPTRSSTPSPAPTQTTVITFTATPSATAPPTATPPNATASPSPTRSSTTSLTATRSATATPTATGSPTGSPALSPTPSSTGTQALSPTPSLTASSTPSQSPVLSPTPTATITPTLPPCGPGVLVADFEDLANNGVNRYCAPNFIVLDTYGSTAVQDPWGNGSGSAPGAGNSSAWSACIDGVILQDGPPNFPYVLFTLELVSGGLAMAGPSVDISPYSPNQGLRFSYKAAAAGVAYRLQLIMPGITDYAYYAYTFTPVNTNWNTQDVYFPASSGTPKFAQPGWGTPRPFTAAQVGAITIGPVATGLDHAYGLCVDDIHWGVAPAGASPTWTPSGPSPTPSPSATASPAYSATATPSSSPAFSPTLSPALSPTPSPTPTSTPCVAGMMVADFEDNLNNAVNKYCAYNFVISDAYGSTINPSPWTYNSGVTPPGTGNASSYAACFDGAIVQDGPPNFPYCLLTVELAPGGGAPGGPKVNVAPYSPNQGLRFSYRAAAAGIPYKVQIPSAGISDYSWYEYIFTPTDTDWHVLDVYFPAAAGTPKFSQPAWGAPVAFDATQVGAIQFNALPAAGSSRAYGLCVDDIGWNAGLAATPTRTPTAVLSATPTATASPAYSDTATPTGTPAFSPTFSPVFSPTPTFTAAPPSSTPTPTPAITLTSSPTPSSTSTPCVAGMMVDDFEDNSSNQLNFYCGYNYTVMDSFGSTNNPFPWLPNSGVAPPGTGNSSAFAACFDGVIVQDGPPNYPYCFFATEMVPGGAVPGGPTLDVAPFSPNQGLRFSYRASASGQAYKVQIITSGVLDYGFYEHNFLSTGTGWQTLDVYFPAASGTPKFSQPGWAAPVPFSTQVGALQFLAVPGAAPRAYGLCVDDIGWNAGVAPASPTASPTFTAVVSPTSSPAYSPTASPTASPTFTTVVSPTFSPIYSPTASPTPSSATSPTSSPSSSPTATACVPGVMLADFEDNANSSVNLYCAYNYTVADSYGSTINPDPYTSNSGAVPPGTGNSSNFAACVDGTIVQDGPPNFPFAVFALELAPGGAVPGGPTVDVGPLSPNQGVRFSYRAAAAGQEYKLQLVTAGILDYGYFEYNFTSTGTDWQTLDVYFPGSGGSPQFARPGWAGPAAFSTQIGAAQFFVVPGAAPRAYGLCVDDIGFHAAAIPGTLTPTRTPSPAVTASPSPTVSPTHTATPALSATPSPTASPTGTASPAFSPTASPAGTLTSTPTATACVPGVMLADFEDNANSGVNLYCGYNYTVADTYGSTINPDPYTWNSGVVPPGTGNSSNFAACFDGTIVPDGPPDYPYCFFALELAVGGGAPGGPTVDVAPLSPNQGLRFSYRASAAGQAYKVQLVTAGVTDYAWYEYNFTSTGTDWQTLDVYFPGAAGSPKFARPIWAPFVPFSTEIGAVQFFVVPGAAPRTYGLCVDDLGWNAP